MTTMTNIAQTVYFVGAFSGFQSEAFKQQSIWSFTHLYNESSIKRFPSGNPTTWKKEVQRSSVVQSCWMLQIRKLGSSWAELGLESSVFSFYQKYLLHPHNAFSWNLKHLNVAIVTEAADEKSLSFGEVSLSPVSYVILGSVLSTWNHSFPLCTVQFDGHGVWSHFTTITCDSVI